MSNTPTKPAEEDRIEPNKSAYTPIVLPTPKKLKSPFAKFEQQAADSAPSPPRFTASSGSGSKKLSWSERQALAKKQQEEEEARSRAASFSPSAESTVPKPAFKSNAPAAGRIRHFGAAGVAAGAGVGLVASGFTKQQEPDESPELKPESEQEQETEQKQEQEQEQEQEPEPEPEPETAVCSLSFPFSGLFTSNL